MKVVQSGAHYTTVEVDTAEAVKFSFPSTSLSVEAAGGDITVALTDTAQAGDDETITVPDGESRMFIHHRMNVDTYYLTGSGTAKLYASNMGDVNPFKAGKRGGDGGGDNTHYKGTTTTALENGSTTNPIIIDGESYTAVFGDVVVYGYTEFVFDGTTWSEFGRPFDTTPTQGSMNAVTSDGIYKRTPLVRGTMNNSAVGGYNSTATRSNSFAYGASCTASGLQAVAFGNGTQSDQTNMFACGIYNSPRAGDLLNIGIGTGPAFRKNIVEVNSTSANVNGDIQINNVSIPTPYTTMPTITASMLGKIVQYVGASDNNYKQGWNYVAVSDGEETPTYSWKALMDTTPTSGSTNAVTSDGVYRNTAGRKYYANGVLKGEVFNTYNNVASGEYSHAEGSYTRATGPITHAEGLITTANGFYCHAEGQNTQASGNQSHAEGLHTQASGNQSHAEGEYTIAGGRNSHASGFHTIANKNSSTVIGNYNVADTNVVHLLIVGNGTEENARSNILEVSETDMNVNGGIQINNVAIPTPYTTMPTITEDMLGKIAMYVGATGNGYTQGCFYIASTDGAAEPTYSWVNLPTSPRTYSETVLYNNDRSNDPETSVVLSAAYTGYDTLCLCMGKKGANWYAPFTVCGALLVNGSTIALSDEVGYVNAEITDTTHITIVGHTSNYGVYKVIGIKY